MSEQAAETKVLINVGQRAIETKEGWIRPTKKPVRLSKAEALRVMKLFKGELIDAEAATENLTKDATTPEKGSPSPTHVNKRDDTPAPAAKPPTPEESKAAGDLAARAQKAGVSVEDLKILDQLEAEEAAKKGKSAPPANPAAVAAAPAPAASATDSKKK